MQVIENDEYSPRTKCPECNETFDPRRGISGKGAFTCPECGSQQRILDAVKQNGRRLDVELHALEGYCPVCDRFFKRVDKNDLALWEKAKVEFEKHKDNLLFPRQKIPAEGRSDPRPVNHGYLYFWEMFNERQLLCLGRLLEAIIKIPEQNVRELLLIAFSDCLDANNMFCKYEVQWHKISLFFGLHAYHPIERPTENNVWGTKYGRCSFIKCFEKVKRAKIYCQHPYERLAGNNHRRLSKYTGDECISGKIVNTFSELTRIGQAALLRCGTSENLSFLPDKSVDAVITDPPYFDNVQYAELADFFYVWLRIALKDLYPWFEPETSQRENEIIQNEKLGKTTEFFSKGLSAVFRECNRVLKDEGLLIFTFHHNKIWAWESIGKILLDTGFYISATPVVRSEGKSGFHSSSGNIRYDCILVCRKRPAPWFETNWTHLKEHILKDVISWARKTLQSGMLVNEVDVLTIIMGKTIEYYTKAFPNLKRQGEPITLAEALQEMKDFLNQVTESAQEKQQPLPKSYIKKVEQLALFIQESKERYEMPKRNR
ncbi:MAG: DNA methyltransferase [Bacillota bacterium]